MKYVDRTFTVFYISYKHWIFKEFNRNCQIIIIKLCLFVNMGEGGGHTLTRVYYVLV